MDQQVRKSFSAVCHSIAKDFSPTTIVAGIIICLVGYTSSAPIVFEAARSFGMGPTQASSWLGILCVAMGIITIAMSLRYKAPIMFAWSTPGAALLLTASAHMDLSAATGAFIVSSVLFILVGVTGQFDRLMKNIPSTIAAAMLAGLLLRFTLQIFNFMPEQPELCIGMLASYFIARKFWPRYSVIVSFAVGILTSMLLQLFNFSDISNEIAIPVFTAPHFEWASIVSLGIPLFIVTMSSQNMTGFTILKSFGYDVPGNKLMTVAGVTNLLIAPFGGYTLNLAAITAAIGMSPESHIDPKRRYTAAVSGGIIYILMGIFAGFVGIAFASFPHELVLGIAGIALFGTVSQGLITALKNEDEREAAMVTFFLTASGVTMMDIGSAFWGLVAGFIVYHVMKYKNSDLVKA